MNPIEIDGHLFCKRITLAGKDETLRHFIVFQRVMGVHLNFTGAQMGAATRADSPLATVAKIDSVAPTGVQDRFRASRHEKSPLGTVELYRHLTHPLFTRAACLRHC